MSEPTKVGLIRCPNCQNLLPDLTGYSAFQCGGCGSVLRANNNNDDADAFIEKLNDGTVEEFSEKLSHKLGKFDFSEKQMMNLSDGSESDVRSNGSSRTRSERTEFLRNKWAFENDEMGNFQIQKDFEDLRIQNGVANLNGSRRTVRKSDWRDRERGEIGQFKSTQKIEIEDVRYSSSMYSEEGPSNYPNGINKIEYLEQDRAELLRKLNEINNQINRSCDLGEKPKEMVHLGRRVVHQDPYGGSVEYSRPPYMDNRHQMAMNSSQVQGFGDSFRPQMPRGVPRQAPVLFKQEQSHSYLYGVDNVIPNMDPFGPYPNNIKLHHPSCSCFHCYNELQRAPPPVPSTAFGNKRFSNVPNNPTFYNQDMPRAFGARDYDPRFANPPPLSSRNPQSHARWPSEVNSEAGGFIRHRPQRPVVAASGRRCCPIASGAPFVTCFNCFELLQLPKKLLLGEKNEKKMRCAGCSTIIFFVIANKKLVVSNHSEAKKSPPKVENKSNVAVNVDSSHTHGDAKWASTDFSSEDYDNSAYDFQSMDIKVASSSTHNGISSKKSVDMTSLHSTSSCASEDEDNSDHLLARRKKADSAEPPMKTKPSPPPKGSALQDHFDYSSKYNRQGIGNESGRSELGRFMPEKAILRQNSTEDLGHETEIEISSNEFSHTGVSQDSGEGSRGEDQKRFNKGAESFFGSIIKKSFRDNSRSKPTTEEERTSVTVNGHPIPDRLVKKAEKLAGPIQPGEYWYDFRAGFWGVMGGPCLGIIPPFIEEFNYPMHKDCASGNTRILVNGRELTEKDLNLLGSRGLPSDEHKSYVLEISGRILDVDSGEELVSLGKLAPTIEKVRRGFGMKIPRAAARA